MKETNMIVVLEDTITDDSIEHASASPSNAEDISKSAKTIQD
jgi:hypothetical protein